jgi:hypothetical protein
MGLEKISMVASKPKLIPPKWMMPENPEHQPSQVETRTPLDARTEERMKWRELKKTWKPPFPRPIIK